MYFSYRLMTYEKTLRREIEDLKETLVSEIRNSRIERDDQNAGKAEKLN